MQQPPPPNSYLEQFQSFNTKYNLRASSRLLRFLRGKKLILIFLALVGLGAVSLFVFLNKSKPEEDPDFLLEYSRTGGTDNYCDSLTIDSRRILTYEDSCLGKKSAAELTDADFRKLDFFLASFQSFSYTSDNQTTGGWQPLISLKLTGRGKNDLLSDPQNFNQLINLIDDLLKNPNLHPVSGFNLGVTPTAAPGLDWQIYTNSLYNFSFEYPQPVKAQEQLSPISPAIFAVTAGPFAVFVYQTPLTLDQFIDTVICQSSQFCTLSQTAHDTELANLPAKRLEHQEASVPTQVTLVRKNDYLYSVNLIIDKSFDKTFDTSEKLELYDQLLGSFQLTQGASAWKTYRNPAYNFEFRYPADYRVSQTGSLTTIAKSRSTETDFPKGEWITIRIREADDFSRLGVQESTNLIYSRELTLNGFSSFVQILEYPKESEAGQSFVTTQIRSNVDFPKTPLIASLKTGVWHYLAPLNPVFSAYEPALLETRILNQLTVYNRIVKTFRFRPYTGDLRAACLLEGGDWLEDYAECLGINQVACNQLSGVYQDCASPCRHSSEAKSCIQQCVKVCTIPL